MKALLEGLPSLFLVGILTSSAAGWSLSRMQERQVTSSYCSEFRYLIFKNGLLHNGRQNKVARTGISQPDTIEVELITLRPSGFEPAEITRPKGAFVLFVDDRTGKESSTLSLMRLSGERIKEARTSKRKSDWHDLIDLTSGAYVLVDAANPEWSCRITILP